MTAYHFIMDNLVIINVFFALIIVFFQRRSPQTVWTWLLLLYFIPILGFILYLVIGQDFHKSRMFTVSYTHLFEIAVIGSDKEQVISNDGVVTDRNIGDREVTVLVEVSAAAENDGEEADTARKNFTLTVPSKNALYPESFPAVDNHNSKPAVIPTLQELSLIHI